MGVGPSSTGASWVQGETVLCLKPGSSLGGWSAVVLPATRAVVLLSPEKCHYFKRGTLAHTGGMHWISSVSFCTGKGHACATPQVYQHLQDCSKRRVREEFEDISYNACTLWVSTVI